MPPPAELLIFEHIQKSAGSTLVSVLQRLFPSGKVYTAQEHNRHATELEEIQALIRQDRRALNLVVSHVGYGFHNFFNMDNLNTQHFTLLRDPIERTVSSFYHHLRAPSNKGTTLKQFLQDKPARRVNVQSLQLSGYRSAVEINGDPHSPCFEAPQDTLEQAKRVLSEELTAFGFTERFDEALMLFRRCFGWSLHKLLYIRQNVNPNKPPAPHFDRDELRLLRDANELDLELYNYALATYQRRLEKIAVSVNRETSQFQRCNAAYGWAMRRSQSAARAFKTMIPKRTCQ